MAVTNITFSLLWLLGSLLKWLTLRAETYLFFSRTFVWTTSCVVNVLVHVFACVLGVLLEDSSRGSTTELRQYMHEVNSEYGDTRRAQSMLRSLRRHRRWYASSSVRWLVDKTPSVPDVFAGGTGLSPAVLTSTFTAVQQQWHIIEMWILTFSCIDPTLPLLFHVRIASRGGC